MDLQNIPGHALPIGFSYQIQVKTWNAINSTAVTVRVLTMLPDYTVQQHVFVHSPGALQNTYTTRYRIDSGWLISVSVDSDTGSILPGQLYAVVSLVRDEISTPQASHVLVAGYISRAIALSWPSVTPKGINDIVPETVYTTVANPAAGADLAYDGAARVTSVPIAISLVLTTSAGVANRRMILQVGAEGFDFVEIVAQTVQTASLAYKYMFTLNGQYDQLTGTKYTMRLPNITLDSLGTIYTAIENIQVADQVSSVRMLLGTRLQGVT